jgi:hypothetical protein
MLEITTGNKSSACFYTLKQAQGLYSLLTLFNRDGSWSYILRNVKGYIDISGAIDVAILVEKAYIDALRLIIVYE